MIRHLRRVAPLALLPLVAACAGSAPSQTVSSSWDVGGGEYLTEEEYQALSSDDALDYCRQLAAEIGIQQDNADAASQAAPGVQAQIDDLKAKLAALEGPNEALAREVAALEARMRELSEKPASYTVMEGDWLRKISAMTRVYSDEEKWKRIFRDNRGKINDPNLIYPGQVFNIPRGMPRQHVVKEGETLRIIAGYWEYYGDRNQSGRIYEANRDKIADPDVIHPGMVLTIPR
ncbi:MAG TPA: LysM peptidoglycan-binding domain-containing protein [bacterium]|nr:LysM peptidoglycan-binding domain-containing protein [bacterium]